MERKTRLNIRIVSVDSDVVSIVQMQMVYQFIGARIAHVPAVMGTLFGSKELDWYRITVGSVAQTNMCATLAGWPPSKTLRVA